MKLMDLNKLSCWENTWKLKFNIDKYQILHIVSRNIKVEYKLNSREIKKNKGYKGYLNDAQKADNHILFSLVWFGLLGFMAYQPL